jgi:hypothetical protein
LALTLGSIGTHLSLNKPRNGQSNFVIPNSNPQLSGKIPNPSAAFKHLCALASNFHDEITVKKVSASNNVAFIFIVQLDDAIFFLSASLSGIFGK